MRIIFNKVYVTKSQSENDIYVLFLLEWRFFGKGEYWKYSIDINLKYIPTYLYLIYVKLKRKIHIYILQQTDAPIKWESLSFVIDSEIIDSDNLNNYIDTRKITKRIKQGIEFHII